MWGRGSPSPEEAPCGALGPPVPSSCRSSAPPRPLKGPRPGAGAAEPGVRPLPPPRRREWLQPGPRPPAHPLLPWSGASPGVQSGGRRGRERSRPPPGE